MNLHIFNPEHDMALAADTPHWTAPHAGRELRCDLGWLPALWAAPGDAVLVDDVTASASAMRRQKACADCGVLFVNDDALRRLIASGERIDRVMPWGWDKAVIGRLTRCGVSAALMPDTVTLARQRELSSRLTAVALLSDIRRDISGLCGDACVLRKVEDIEACRTAWHGVVLKAPWSCSGRGVRYLVPGESEASTMQWAAKTLRTQGALTAERLLNKTEDFGMEFTAGADGVLRYNGLSVFATRHGAYTGNVLATEAEKEAVISRRIPLSLLHEVRRYVARWLEERIAGAYVGPLGVDMLVAQSDNSQLLNPCVEINLRRTMGHVALALSPDANGQQCLMQIGYEGRAYRLRVLNDHELLF